MSQAPVDLEQSVPAAAQAADAALDRACSARAWQLSDDDVEAGLATLLSIQARTLALQTALLAEAGARGMHQRTHAFSPERWLADRFRLSRADAGARLRQSVALGRHQQVLGALPDAELTGEQADVVADTLDNLAARPEISEADRADGTRFLLDQAGALSPRELARAGRALVEALTAAPDSDDPTEAATLAREQEAAEHAARLSERNVLRFARRPGDRSRTRLDLGPIGTAALAAWLSAHADPPHPGTDGLEDERDRDERRGDALVELVARALNTEPDPTPSAPATDTPASDQPATKSPTSNPPASPPPAPGRATTTPVQVTVTVPCAALQHALAGAGVLDTGGTLSGAELRRLACDAAVIPVVLGGRSQVLDVGQVRREWTTAQRRAVIARDRGCVAPGCDRPPADCQVHHQWEWATGGPTDVDNAALLCLYHHQQVHRQGWALTMAANGFPQLVPPGTVDPQRRPRQHHRFRLTLLTGRKRQ